MTPRTFINRVDGKTVICENFDVVSLIDGVEYSTVHLPNDKHTFLLPKNDLSWIMDNVAKHLQPVSYNNKLSNEVDCIINYDVVETDWLIKRWIKIDQDKIQQWYADLLVNYEDWKWSYGKHKGMWKYDPQELIGNHMKDDTSWIMLTWGDDTKGPVPWLRYIAKSEYDTYMPRNIDFEEFGVVDNQLGARECFTGYAREIINNMPAGPHDIQVAIHTPGTKLPQHQDMPDKLRFHIPIQTNEKARFIINGHDVHIPADGWVYLVNTSYLHHTDNQSNTDRVHIYGAVWTHQLLDLNLNDMETFL